MDESSKTPVRVQNPMQISGGIVIEERREKTAEETMAEREDAARVFVP